MMAARKKSVSFFNKITDSVIERARRKPRPAHTFAADEIFKPWQPPPGTFGTGAAEKIAMDEASSAQLAWAARAIGAAFAEGITFLGYPYLAELAQRPEYRKMSERLATEMTRKWIKFSGTGDEDKTEKIKELVDYLDALDLRGAFRQAAENDGFFGRAHIYVDLGTTDDPAELKTPIGNGWNDVSAGKIGKGKLRAFRPIEPLWCYPSNYNANDPLKGTWYAPDLWFVQGKELHVSRLLTFVGREVPDLLKPAYAFGGLSLSQMAKPYVDNWVRNRQAVSDLIRNFAVTGIKTNLQNGLAEQGEEMFRRADLLNAMRDNRGLLLLQNGDPATAEEFFCITTPLGTLDALLAQSLEQLALPSGLPLLILLGIQPAGLNASSEGEIRAFYDWVNAFQVHLFKKNLNAAIGIAMMSLWGKVDKDIKHDFVPLWSLDEKAQADVNKTKADTDSLYLDNGSLAPNEVRRRLVNDPMSGYEGLDPDEMPEIPPDEEGLIGPGRKESEADNIDTGKPEAESGAKKAA